MVLQRRQLPFSSEFHWVNLTGASVCLLCDSGLYSTTAGRLQWVNANDHFLEYEVEYSRWTDLHRCRMSRTRLASGEILIPLAVMSDEIANSQPNILMHYFCFLGKIILSSILQVIQTVKYCRSCGIVRMKEHLDTSLQKYRVQVMTLLGCTICTHCQVPPPASPAMLGHIPGFRVRISATSPANQ